jgi:vacuolar-type H+-ATPase subunit B/Vma2
MVMTLCKARLMILMFTLGRRLNGKAPLIDKKQPIIPQDLMKMKGYWIKS